MPPLELALATDLGGFTTLSDPERIVGNLYFVGTQSIAVFFLNPLYW